MAEKAADATKGVAEDITEQGKRAAAQATQAAREMADKAEDLGRRGLQVVERTAGAVGDVQREVAQCSVEGTAEFGEVLTGLLRQQTEHNLETMTALTRAVDWEQVAQIQSAYLRASMERMGQLTQRYLEISQTVISSASSVMTDKVRQAA